MKGEQPPALQITVHGGFLEGVQWRITIALKILLVKIVKLVQNKGSSCSLLDVFFFLSSVHSCQCHTHVGRKCALHSDLTIFTTLLMTSFILEQQLEVQRRSLDLKQTSCRSRHFSQTSQCQRCEEGPWTQSTPPADLDICTRRPQKTYLKCNRRSKEVHFRYAILVGAK